MVILADSGSTKISGKFIAGGFVHSLETVGFNAVFSDDKQLLSLLETQVKPNTSSVKEIHFFGAGVIPGTPAEKLRRVLSTVWPGASAARRSAPPCTAAITVRWCWSWTDSFFYFKCA